jgi:enterochelin esterase family protein
MGQEFLFAVETEKDAAVSIDKEPPIPMKRVAGTNYWYLLKMLRLGTTHQHQYFGGGQPIQGAQYQVAGYNPDSYPMQASRAAGSRKKTLKSTVYPEMSSNYWVYVNPGVDTTRGAPLMVWQDGETIVGNQDLMRLRLQIVSDNLVAKKLIPPMVHVLIQPGTGGKESRMMRSIEYDTVSERYGKYVLEEVMADVEKTYKVRPDGYSRAIAGASSGAICAFNVAWYYPSKFSRVLSHIGSYVALQWRPEQNLDGGYIVSRHVGRDPKKNIRVWLSDGADDQKATPEAGRSTIFNWRMRSS